MADFELPRLADRACCVGCGACAAGCPKGAIHMLPDREGFLYPTVTDACVQCGHCTHICPVLKQRERRPDPAVFAAWSDEERLRRRSSAGGVFALLADWVLEGGGTVFAAGLDEHLRLRHTAARSPAELAPLLGRKPVQSATERAFPRVRDCLGQGRFVLFCGTPCQVDALYRFLGEHPENLITADVLCRGVVSPGVWEKLLEDMAYVKRKRPVAVSFCAKPSLGGEERFRVTFDDGSVYDVPYHKSELGRGQRRRLLLRPACHTCPYTSTHRVGDLSLGRFDGPPGELLPEARAGGLSLLLVNTPRGAQMLDVLPLHREGRRLADAVAANPALAEPVGPSPQREAFFHAFARLPIQQVRGRFLSPLAAARGSRPRPLGRLLDKLKDIRDKGGKPLWKKR